jgi:2,3-dihydroxybenzoate decarboxylase
MNSVEGKQEEIMRKIALEEHFTTHTYQAFLEKQLARNAGSMAGGGGLPPHLVERLLDLDQERLRSMDEADIAMQVLSLSLPGLEHIPPVDAIPLALDINDELADAIRRHPTRLAGFAALPILDPPAAAQELERAVTKLGLKGALLNGQPEGGFLDEERYRDIFATAQALDVPLYLHPAMPAPATLTAYEGRPELIGPFWSFTVDSATQALRLIVSGVFDQFPRLHILLGHLGETLPYLLWRLDSRWRFSPFSQKLKQTPSAYFRQHFLVTTSGMFHEPTLIYACAQLGTDRVLFAVDYPFEPNQAGASFIEAVALPAADKEKICSGNAQRLLKLSPETA